MSYLSKFNITVQTVNDLVVINDTFVTSKFAVKRLMEALNDILEDHKEYITVMGSEESLYKYITEKERENESV